MTGSSYEIQLLSNNSEGDSANQSPGSTTDQSNDTGSLIDVTENLEKPQSTEQVLLACFSHSSSTDKP